MDEGRCGGCGRAKGNTTSGENDRMPGGNLDVCFCGVETDSHWWKGQQAN